MENSVNNKLIDEFLEIAIPVCTRKKVLSMGGFIQHGKTTCLEHCIAVAFTSFAIAVILSISLYTFFSRMFELCSVL